MTEHSTTDETFQSTATATTTLEPRDFDDDGFATDRESDLGNEDWPTHVAKSGIRLRMPTAILLAVLLAAGGLWGGSLLQKHNGGSTSAAGVAGARAALGRAGGLGSSAASGSTATTGTVTDIIGSSLYVTESNGTLVKVTLSSSATVTRDAKSSLSALKAGDTVVVQGSTVSGGSMTASSVSATQAGVSAATGGGGFGGGTSRSGASS